MNLFNLSARPDLRESRVGLSDAGLSSLYLNAKDCTAYSRIGFRGDAAEQFLESKGLPVPSKPNQSLMWGEGLVVLRLSNYEFWVVDISNNSHGVISELEIESRDFDNVYLLFCQHSHACFLISGEKAATMFAKVCSVDLRSGSFPTGDIAQTIVARTSSIVVRQEVNKEACFIILSDLSSSKYLWESLVDAGTEFI